MKKGILIVLMSVLILMLTNCGKSSSNSAETGTSLGSIKRDTSAQQKEKDIELIKELRMRSGSGIYRKTVYLYKVMNVIAGVEGDVNWSASYPDEYKDKPNLFIAEGIAKDARSRELRLIIVVNRKSRLFDIKGATANGEEFNEWELERLFDCDECGD